jgi:DNA-directed RNA polymerase subunit beta'
MLPTTVGQILVNSVLPPPLQRHDRVLNKKGVTDLFSEIYQQYPEQYRDIAQKLMTLGHHNAQASGTTVSLKDLLPHPETEKNLAQLRRLVDNISQGDESDEIKQKKVVDLVLKASPLVEKEVYQRGIESGNNLAEQVLADSRGNKSQLKQLVAGDMLVEDHRHRTIPVPILHGYGHGLTPAEYWAASYGARQGTVSTKFATREAGFLGKQLAMIGHRLVVSSKDCGTNNGLPVDGGDPDNVGATLASPVDGHAVGTIITPQMTKAMAGKPITVRSPMTCQADHGVCSLCSGVREHGRLPGIGENVGMSAAQAIAEPLAQGMLSAKHGGGAVKGEKPKASGFAYLNQMIQVPKSFRDAATIAQQTGRVHEISDAPQGGKFVHIGDHQHYVPPERDVTVQTGQKMDAGDALSDGIANPADIVEHKGIGEGRRQFVGSFSEVLKNSGFRAHRRNLELLSRGLINHVRINDLDGLTGHLPDDVVGYDHLSKVYKPRADATVHHPQKAIGQYLEKPALHYSIGTKVTTKAADEMTLHGVNEVMSHPTPPPFSPEITRGMETGLRDPNWRTRMAGSYLERGFMQGVHRGEASATHDTSYIPSLSSPSEFGKDLKTKGLY